MEVRTKISSIISLVHLKIELRVVFMFLYAYMVDFNEPLASECTFQVVEVDFSQNFQYQVFFLYETRFLGKVEARSRFFL